VRRIGRSGPIGRLPRTIRDTVDRNISVPPLHGSLPCADGSQTDDPPRGRSAGGAWRSMADRRGGVDCGLPTPRAITRVRRRSGGLLLMRESPRGGRSAACASTDDNRVAG